MTLSTMDSGPYGDASRGLAGAGQPAPAGESRVDTMLRTAVPVGRSGWGTFVPAPGRPESADFNFGLLAALAACVAFWVLVALTVYWLV